MISATFKEQSQYLSKSDFENNIGPCKGCSSNVIDLGSQINIELKSLMKLYYVFTIIMGCPNE